MNNYDLKISRKRQERSKDSNGTDIKIKISDNIMYYTERSWGFKAKKGIIQKEIALEEADIKHIKDFIIEKELNKNYEKEIIVKKRHSFTIYTYNLTLILNEKTYIINITSNTETQKSKFNDIGHENVFFCNIVKLYNLLIMKVE